MRIEANSIKEYIEALPEDRQKVIKKIRTVIRKNIPKGFKECLSYNMIGWVVPLSKYPDGYHCNPELPLPFMNLASQKNYIALYHSGIYADPKINKWFVKEYPKHSQRKLDMGKSCIRFKKMDDIPYDLIGELVSKITPDEWIAIYEMALKKR